MFMHFHYPWLCACDLPHFETSGFFEVRGPKHSEWRLATWRVVASHTVPGAQNVN